MDFTFPQATATIPVVIDHEFDGAFGQSALPITTIGMQPPNMPPPRASALLASSQQPQVGADWPTIPQPR
jgi:hypothetical protein